MVSASNISAPASAVDEPAIRTIALTRRFGRVHALRGVDLHVPRGSITGFIGNNGAGKTTTIHALLGFIPPTSGRAFVLGFDSQTRGIQIRRRVGFFPERDHPYEWMRLRMLFEMGAAAYETWDRDLCARLCAQFELDPKRRIRELSKGMAAKAKLVFALAHRPECLILDEPTSGLDPASRYELLCLIRRLTVERNATALFSSHILDDVAGIATDIAEGLVRVMGRLLYNLIATLDLQRVSLGGSVFWHNRDWLLPRLAAQIHGKLPSITGGVQLAAAGLGDKVGDYGPLALLD